MTIGTCHHPSHELVYPVYPGPTLAVRHFAFVFGSFMQFLPLSDGLTAAYGVIHSSPLRALFRGIWAAMRSLLRAMHSWRRRRQNIL